LEEKQSKRARESKNFALLSKENERVHGGGGGGREQRRKEISKI